MANDLVTQNPDNSDDRLKSLAKKIREEFQQLGLAFHKSADQARRIGDFFNTAKAECKKRGENFEPWVRAEFQISERTAQAYMRVTNKWGELEKAQALRLSESKATLKLLANPKPSKPLTPPPPPEPPKPQDQDVIDAEFETIEPPNDVDAAGVSNDGEAAAAEDGQSANQSGQDSDTHGSEAHASGEEDGQAAVGPDPIPADVAAPAPADSPTLLAAEECQRATDDWDAAIKEFGKKVNPTAEDRACLKATGQRMLDAIKASTLAWEEETEKWAAERERQRPREQKAAAEKAERVLIALQKKLPDLRTEYKKKVRTATKHIHDVVEEIKGTLIEEKIYGQRQTPIPGPRKGRTSIHQVLQADPWSKLRLVRKVDAKFGQTVAGPLHHARQHGQLVADPEEGMAVLHAKWTLLEIAKAARLNAETVSKCLTNLDKCGVISVTLNNNVLSYSLLPPPRPRTEPAAKGLIAQLAKINAHADAKDATAPGDAVGVVRAKTLQPTSSRF